MKLTQIAVDNPVFATMMMVALLVMGLFSYRQLGIDQFPNVDFPIVVVTTNYPGASPEAVEVWAMKFFESPGCPPSFRRTWPSSWGHVRVLLEA